MKKKMKVEKSTGEKYKSAKSMKAHEKKESMSERIKEYGKAGAKKGKK